MTATLDLLNKPDDAGERVYAHHALAMMDEIQDNPIDTWRWGTVCERIVQDRITGKFYGITYRTQPEEGVQDADHWQEYEPRTKTVKFYAPVES